MHAITSAATDPRRRIVALVLALAVGAMMLTGCLSAAGKTNEIEAVSSVTVDGWKYDFFRNRAYPCSISGYQTFVIGTKVGSANNAAAPLWVKMHGGGVGWFDAAGNPKPSAGNKTEESRARLLGYVDAGLMARIMTAPEGFRLLIVSMCNHDLYAGGDKPDPNNPNVEPDGTPVTSNGLFATKAAIQYTRDHFPTTDYFLHGTSAGSAGSFHVAWSLQLQQIPPAGIVADSGIVNELYERGQIEQGLPCARPADAIGRISARWHPDLAKLENQPDLLMSDGRLTVPVMHVWNQGDKNVCSNIPMQCPLRDGTTVTMASAECTHEPMRLAIEAQGPASRSDNLGVCVENDATPETCDVHVVTTGPNRVNIDPAFPADFLSVITAWVQARIADS